ncbi:unannotated protein [freshwater metagenome]|uniref:Unannotated protein n=1 Tax=freshwater metagenome TaxID=449393 RepID=A0A6J6SEC9_9ZZZZ
MTNFIDAEFFALFQIAFVVKGFLFEETNDSGGRINELLIGMT